MEGGHTDTATDPGPVSVPPARVRLVKRNDCLRSNLSADERGLERGGGVESERAGIGNFEDGE